MSSLNQRGRKSRIYMKIVSRIGIGDISKTIKTNKTKKHFIRRENGARFMGGYL